MNENDYEKIYQSRIEELIAELSDCREDERNSQNQILQVISVVGTILSFLFGISYFNTGDINTPLTIFQNIKTETITGKISDILNQNITPARVMFWLGLLIFATAFTYITVLGINNVLRYYYIQTIEDRLCEMIPIFADDNGRGKLLHWNEYSAPIITKNPKHITSSHTVLNYLCYTTATICIVIFSMGIVASLFQRIDPRKWFDTLLLLIVLIAMALTFFLFLRLSSHAEEVAQFALNTAHDNQKMRQGETNKEPYEKAKYFRRMLSYLFYPKKQDIQKVFLIIIGFICGIPGLDANFEVTYIYRLLFVLFVFDFLAYQARYQINDIRGIEEDKEAGDKNRLIFDDSIDEQHAIKISSLVAVTKIIVALLLTLLFGGTIKKLLLMSLIILFVSTVAYEVVRNKEIVGLIYFFVGTGYPLRFLVGFFSVMPEVKYLGNIQMICLIIALWAYGSFSSVLSWINQVSKRMQDTKNHTGSFPSSYKKKYFKNLHDLIIDKYESAEKHPVNEKILPLHEKCSLFELWNIIFIICLSFLMLIAFLQKISKVLLCLEITIFIVFAINGCFKAKYKLLLIWIGLCSIMSKMILARITLENNIWYLILSGIQFLVTFTYFILCYQPQFGKYNLKTMIKLLKMRLFKLILGEYAANKLGSKKS